MTILDYLRRRNRRLMWKNAFAYLVMALVAIGMIGVCLRDAAMLELLP